MPVISVITPFYKGNRYINDLVSNIAVNAKNLQSKMPGNEVELLIVNDSPGCPVELQKCDEAIHCRIIEQKNNMGIHQARVTGLAHCKGDIILFLDQDDTIAEDFFVKQLPYLKDADVVVGNAYLEDQDKNKKVLYKTKGDFEKVLLPEVYIKTHNQIVSPGQCLIRKASIPKEWITNITKANGSDDLLLWLLLFYSGARFQLNPDCLYTHHYTGENISASGEKIISSSLEIAEYLKKAAYFPDDMIEPFVRSRETSSALRNASAIGKIFIYTKNIDIFFVRIKWKLKSILSF